MLGSTRPRVAVRVAVLLSAGALGIAATGCGARPGNEPTTTVRVTDSTGASDAAADPTVSPGPAATRTAAPTPTKTPPARHEPQAARTPATVSGPLTVRNLPSATDVGRGFRAHAVPSNGEEGTVSNGSSVQERSPASVVDGLVPLGCPGVDEAGRIPAPAHALERSYRSADGRSAVALVLQYADDAGAAQLMSTLRRMLRHCTAPSAPVTAGAPRTVAAIATGTADTLVDTRHEIGAGADPTRWDETVVRSGSRVSLLVVQRATQDATAPAAGPRLRHQRAGLAR